MSRLLKTEPVDEEVTLSKGNFESVVSTGSTLLDLAISGTRIRGGGIPGGILVEIFGPSGHGKTTLLGEIGASAQSKGGFFLLGDAEHRISKDYAEMMGIKITDKNYRRPSTVKDCEQLIFETPETGNGIIDVTGIDSIAVLLSELDQSEDGDKRGSARAKELHQMVRKAKSEIAKSHRIVVFTNQVQDVQSSVPFGPSEKTPGGHAVPFMASLRIRIGPAYGGKLSNERTYGGKKIKHIIGIRSQAEVIKSTIDIPFRSAEIPIVFQYGIDDIRANLVFCKKFHNESAYMISDTEGVGTIDVAIRTIEQAKEQHWLKERTTNLWEDIQSKFEQDRSPKER